MKPKLLAATESLLEDPLKVIILAPDTFVLKQNKNQKTYLPTVKTVSKRTFIFRKPLKGI